MTARWMLVAACLAALPAAAQTYSNGGPQPGDQGIGVMPLPDPGKPPSSDGIVIGQDSQIGDAITQATNQAAAQDATTQGPGSQGVGTQTLPPLGTGTQDRIRQGTGAPQSRGQGGFVADSTGLGNVTDSSTPAATGPRKETVQVTQAPGAVVRWLDKVSGRTEDITLSKGQAKTAGRLTISLGQCRYPVADPSSNAYAYLTIHDSLVKTPIYQGWMIASSPALDPLDSPRYDVWLLHCTTS